MTATQVVEEALRSYVPPPAATDDEALPPGLVRKGHILVKPATGRVVTMEDLNAAIAQDRNERGL